IPALVIELDVVEAQILEEQVGAGRKGAAAAVGHHRLVRGDALGGQFIEYVLAVADLGGLLVQEVSNRNGFGTGNHAVFRGRQKTAVEDDGVRGADVLGDEVPFHTVFTRPSEFELARRDAGGLGGQLAFPLAQAAVKNVQLVEAGIFQHDVGASCHGGGAINQQGVVIADARLAQGPRNLRVVGVFVANAIALGNVQCLPGQMNRTGNMPLGVFGFAADVEDFDPSLLAQGPEFGLGNDQARGGCGQAGHGAGQGQNGKAAG